MAHNQIQRLFQPTLLLAGFVAGMSCGSLAHGKAVVVQFRSPSTFQTLRREIRETHNARTVVDAFGDTRIEAPRLWESKTPVVKTLDQLNMAVVEVSSDEELQALAQNPEIAFAEPEIMYPAPTPLVSAPSTVSTMARRLDDQSEFPWGIEAVEAPALWNNVTAGQGAKVLVLDTGIDKDHPDLAPRFFAGRNFFSRSMAEHEEDDEASGIRGGSFLLNMSAPFGRTSAASGATYDYFDQNGHGTHVSGTIAAAWDQHGVVGVAPEAKLLMGRVCGKFGCSSVAIVNGVNWAIEQGVDVISMSLGGPLDSRAQREALENADRAGIVAVAASGNDGTNKISFPAANPTVISVGAVDSTLHRATFSQYGPELDIVAPGVDVMSSVPRGSGRESQVKLYRSGSAESVKSTSFVGSPEVDQALKENLVYAGLGKAQDFNSAVRGRIALIQRGEIAFAEKVKNAINAGAIAAVVFNNEPGLISGALTQDGSTVEIPVVMIEKDIGESLRDSLAAGNTEALSMKTLKTDYAAFQGTSMATPHVAGVVALIKAANHQLSPAQVRAVLKRTAKPLERTPDNEYGAGMVNAEAAVQAALRM